MKKILFSVLLLASSVTYTMDQNNKEEDELVSSIDSETSDQLNKLTVYKRDMYLERLVETGVVSLDQIRAIHTEIEKGLDYSPRRMDKKSGKRQARWECAMRLAPEGIKEFVKARKIGRNVLSRCPIILLVGRYGVGKETLAKGIAHTLGLKQMVVPAHQLLDETQLGTDLRVRDLILDFSSRNDTALILDNVDCLLARRNKYTDPKYIYSTLRSINRSYRDKNQSNFLICTGEESHLYPDEFVSEISTAARLDAPNANQRLEIVKVMFADEKAVFESQAEEYLEENLREIETITCANLQRLVNAVTLNAGLSHSLGDRESAEIRKEDVEYGLRVMKSRM